MPVFTFRSAKAPSSARSYGFINNDERLLVAYRATNTVNLAKKPYTVSQTGGEYADGFLLSDGNGGLQTNVVDADVSNFTMLAVAGVKVDQQNSDVPFSHFIGGTSDRVDFKDWFGFGLRLNSIDNGDQTLSVILGGYVAGKSPDGSPVLKTTKDTFVVNHPKNQDFPLHFYVLRNAIINGKSVVSIMIKSAGVVITSTEDTNSLSAESRDSGHSLQIGSIPYNNTSFDGVTHKLRTKEFLLYNQGLSDNDIEQQYQSTKKWLSRSGVDVSHWV